VRLAARVEELEAQLAPPAVDFFDVASHCFPKQLPFVASRAKLRTACCGRRSGKSEACAAVLVDVALQKPGGVGLYLTTTRVNAKRILWRPLKRLLREKGLAATPNEAELSVSFANGSVIHLAGVQHRDEVEKYRGMPLAVVVMDEAQLLSVHLETLLDEVLSPALMDYDGALVLAGTPAPTPTGYFWECLEGKYASAWERHSWTPFDNPHILAKSGKTAQQHLDAELARRNVTADDAKIQREWYARWAFDPSSLVFRYDAGVNHYDALPAAGGEWECVLAVDLGFDDADAIAVLAWNTTLPSLWLTHESVLPKQTVTQLGERLQLLVTQHNPMRVVVDTGGLGRKIAEELTARWGLNVVAAEKERKLEHIELLNDALRSGRLKAKRDSRFAQDAMLVEWDKSNPEKWKLSERFHSDICDAVLYGYRLAKQWLSQPEAPPAARVGTPEWMQAMAAQQQAQEAAAWAQRRQQHAQHLAEAREAAREEDSFLW
jgi:hypothetical protein